MTKKLYRVPVEIEFEVCAFAEDTDEALALAKKNWRKEMSDGGAEPVIWHPSRLKRIEEYSGADDDMPYGNCSNQKTIGELLKDESDAFAEAVKL